VVVSITKKSLISTVASLFDQASTSALHTRHSVSNQKNLNTVHNYPNMPHRIIPWQWRPGRFPEYRAFDSNKISIAVNRLKSCNL